MDWYSWGQYGNVFVPESHIMVDEENQKATYDSISEAKQACEALGSVQCFGIYDAHCDGATAAKPLVLVASPGLDLNEVEESSVGSCIYHMEIGSGTTTTTTVAEHCTWAAWRSRPRSPSGSITHVYAAEVPRNLIYY